MLLAQNTVPDLASYNSSLNYKLKYPQSWYMADPSNTEAARTLLFSAGTDSVKVTGTYSNFVLSQIDSLEIKAAFFEKMGSDLNPVIVVNTGPFIKDFKDDTQDLYKRRFQSLLTPTGAIIKALDASVSKDGLKKTLVLSARTAAPGSQEDTHYSSLTFNGNGRSFTFTLRGSAEDITRLSPVLKAMSASLEDDLPSTNSFRLIPTGIEVLLIILLSLMIAWLAMRIINQGQAYSRHRSRRGISFFPLFLLVCIVLLALSYLLSSCQV